MCGIGGIVRRDGDVSADELRAFLRQLQHRGPDDAGVLQWTPGRSDAFVAREARPAPCAVGLIHRRLAILDLHDTAWQPMSSQDGRHHLVFNGEIYNFLELRADLERKSLGLRSTGDTEVLLNLLVERDVQALSQLVGMFAFAWLDTKRRRLVLARDPFGIKPLYYAWLPSGIAFSSEIRPLLGLPEVTRTVDVAALEQYLRFGISDHSPRTAFAMIRQVPPGHWLAVDVSGPRPADTTPYWTLPRARSGCCSFDEASEKLRETFLESIRLHLRSDVPVGTALSGGIDSSAIVTSVRRVGGPAVDIRTFSFTAPGTDIDEDRWMAVAASASGAHRRTVTATANELVDDLDRLIELQEEPFGSTTIYAQYRVFKLAAESGIKVMLDGQGADELFAGYRPYVAARVASLLRHGRALAGLQLARHASALPGGETTSRTLKRAAAAIAPVPVVAAARRLLARRDVLPTWFDGRWFADRGVLIAQPIRRGHRSTLDDTLRQEFTTTSLPALLRYEDRNSMAHSIESRVPFLTTQMANLAFSYPESALIDDRGTSKAVLRSAMRGIVPDVILDRRDKIGFATPEHEWLQSLTPWVQQVLHDGAAGVGGLRHKAVLEHWADVQQGRQPFDWTVWRFINVIRWSQLFDVVYP